MKEIFAYVDPGSGFVFLQQTSFLWAALIGIFGFFIFFFKFFFRFIKKLLWIFLVLVCILIIIGGIMNKEPEGKKVIIFGIDAMDPNITEKLIGQGRLPNFSYLKNNGSSSSLKTTNPSESVVAWSSFATGLNPGNHGIFDFIMRSPWNYMPYLSLNEISNTPGIKVRMRRKGRTFWEILSKHKIPCHIFFCPNTFPAEKIYGEMLSGMGTPDLYGTMGRFCFYTNKDVNEEKKKDSRGKIISVMPDNYIIETAIYGPKIDSKGTTKEISIPLKIILKPNKNEIEIKLQQKLLILKRGAWSNWQRIYFDIGPFKKIYGIVKFYLKSIEPGFELYLSPINFDPQNPIFPISYPPDYSQKLSKRIGLYYTQGMPNDTWALNEGWFDERIFLQQLDLVLEEKKKILTEELKHFKKGVFFMYIDSLDIVQHMFWRYIDPEYPHFVQDSTYNDTIYKYYEKIDSILGEILKSLKKDTTLIALSDHGFNSFRRAVHLNRWLLENGFLYLKEGRGKSDEFFEDVNWAKTKAYALGFGGIYINMKNRESEGIVSAGEENLIKREISDKLKLWIDPVTHEKVLKDIYTKEDIFKGIYMADAPDLFVGFNPGFRTSWQTALGGVPEIIIEDNTKKWSGDHLFDPSFVPGVIFMNKRIKLDSPSITDIASTILKLFDIPEYKETNGKNIF